MKTLTFLLKKRRDTLGRGFKRIPTTDSLALKQLRQFFGKGFICILDAGFTFANVRKIRRKSKRLAIESAEGE